MLDSEQLLQETYESLQARAEASYKNARLSIKQLSELAPKDDPQYGDEINYLSDLLADSGSALDSGRLLDSISLANHIQSRTLEGLEGLPAPASGELITNDMLIMGFSILFLAVLLYLLTGRKPPGSTVKFRKLARTGTENNLELG